MAPTKPARVHATAGTNYRGPLGVSPLARAALDNGVPFADVQAYCEGRRVADPELQAAWYEALNAPPEVFGSLTEALVTHCEHMRTDTVLDAALARSVAGRELERARLWWQGAL